MPFINYLFCLFPAVVLSGCGMAEGELAATPRPSDKPTNIILMIGDGMGLSQVSAALYSNDNQLALESFPVIGFHKSHCSSDLITDSAAGATAFACGVKTYRGAVGVNPDTLPCRTIVEEANDRGLATGLLVTSTVVHATPAAFFAHQPLRTFYEAIALDLLDSDVDLVIGGGKRYFDRRESDGRNLYRELQQKGYHVTDYFVTDYYELDFNPRRKMAYFTADDQPLFQVAGREYLPLLTDRALTYLERRSEQGFFMVIEGSQIDWGGHANAGDIIVSETLDFDRTIKRVLDFARKRGNTLVLVTADHETGGMAVNPGSKMGRLEYGFTTNSHTATLIPVYAYGPSARLFSGIYDNTQIYHRMRQALGFSETASACP